MTTVQGISRDIIALCASRSKSRDEEDLSECRSDGFGMATRGNSRNFPANNDLAASPAKPVFFKDEGDVKSRVRKGRIIRVDTEDVVVNLCRRYWLIWDDEICTDDNGTPDSSRTMH